MASAEEHLGLGALLEHDQHASLTAAALKAGDVDMMYEVPPADTESLKKMISQNGIPITNGTQAFVCLVKRSPKCLMTRSARAWAVSDQSLPPSRRRRAPAPRRSRRA